MTSYVAGVDAGGTKTEAWGVGAEGSVLSRAAAGPANPLTAGVGAAADAVAESLAALCRETAAAPSAICIGMAGIGRECERRQVVAALIERGLPLEGWDYDVARLLARGPVEPIGAGQALLDHDAMIALAACTGCEPGIVLIAGTGSIAFGVDEHGRRHRSGGWGHLFDDPGSGYWIGREALAAVFQAYDGRGEATALTERVCRAMGSPDVPALTSLVHASANAKATVAALAPMCGEAASAGDPAACRIVRAAAVELRRMVDAVIAAGAFGPGPVKVGLQGGAIAGVEGLRAEVSRELSSADCAPATMPPAAGAAMLAMKALGWDASALARHKA